MPLGKLRQTSLWRRTYRTGRAEQENRVQVAAYRSSREMTRQPSGCTETASRIRGRIENVSDWAKKKLPEDDNPVRWKNLLDKLLPGRSKGSHRWRQHTALSFADLPS